MSTKIIHCDCDCFYAAIEMRDAPHLAEKALAIGGTPQERGVIATCNYEARRFGVRSAQSSAHALRLCPQLLILPPAMEKYRQVSHQILAIYQRYSEIIEPISLDEAYLDVSDSALYRGSATLIAQAIRHQVRSEVGITVSAGVAPNKFLAKIASDWNKPDGLFVITPDQVSQFVAELPVDRLHGVGPVTAARLHALGVVHCRDLTNWQLADLIQQFGRFGQRLYELCRGHDDRPVMTQRKRKSVSVEHTYAKDLNSLTECQTELQVQYEKLLLRLERIKPPFAIHKLFVKLRFADFQQTTVECLAETATIEQFNSLLTTAYYRAEKSIRLIGVGIRANENIKMKQLDFFSSSD